MNWCKIIGHNWNYDVEKHEIEYRHLHIGFSTTTSSITSSTRPNSIVKFDVRLCKRCFKKQRANLGVGVYNFKLGKYCNWKEMKLTKSEEREKNINK